VKGVILYVDTRWNSFTDSLEHGIELRPLLDTVCVATQFNVPNRPHLDRLKLSPAEWDHIEALLPLLKVSTIIFDTLLKRNISLVFLLCDPSNVRVRDSLDLPSYSLHGFPY